MQRICRPLPHGSGTLDGRYYLALQLCGKNMSNALLQASALTRTSAAVRSAGTHQASQAVPLRLEQGAAHELLDTRPCMQGSIAVQWRPEL